MAAEPTKKELEFDALLEKMDGDLGKIERRTQSGTIVRPTRVMNHRQLKRTRLVLQTLSEVEIEIEEEEKEAPLPIKRVNGKR